MSNTKTEPEKKKRRVPKWDDTIQPMPKATLNIMHLLLTPYIYSDEYKPDIDEKRTADLHSPEFLLQQFSHPDSNETKEKMVQAILALKPIVSQLVLTISKAGDKKRSSSSGGSAFFGNEDDQQCLANLNAQLKEIDENKQKVLETKSQTSTKKSTAIPVEKATKRDREEEEEQDADEDMYDDAENLASLISTSE